MANTARKTPAKKAAKATTVRRALNRDAKIMVDAKVENPFREGTAVFKRVRAVLTAKGKPVDYALKHGARPSTVRFLEKAKVIRLVTR